jgi:hypothetical protein
MAEGASLDQKQRLQQLFFPEGIAFPTPGLLPSSRQAFIDAPSSRHAARLGMTVTTRAILDGDAIPMEWRRPANNPQVRYSQGWSGNAGTGTPRDLRRRPWQPSSRKERHLRSYLQRLAGVRGLRHRRWQPSHDAFTALEASIIMS